MASLLPLGLLPLGERLTHLRTRLTRETPTLLRATRLTPATLARLENTGTGQAASLAALLPYYQDRPVNLAWLLAPDNPTIPLHAFRDISQPQNVQEVCYQLRALIQQLPPVAPAEPGGAPAPGTAALLGHRHQPRHWLLAQLLPPIRLVDSQPDLGFYQ